MLYLLLILTIILWIIAIFTISDYRGESISDQLTFILGTFIGIPSLIAILCCWGVYSYRTETINSQLEVLESQNTIILSQIEPVIQKALDFESNTYKELKVNPENIITLSQIYPDLKDNSFIQTQLSVILTNQQQITQLKLNKATLKYLHAEDISIWTLDTYDWCNKNHFDYRCLIEKGLAIDATGLNIY